MTMATAADARNGISIDPGTTVGPVRLTVADLDASRSFYERAIGLRPFERDDGTISFGTRRRVRWSSFAASAPRRR